MSNMIRVSLELDIDLKQWRENGFELAEDEEVEFAKEEFMEWIHAMSDVDIYDCLDIKDVD